MEAGPEALSFEFDGVAFDVAAPSGNGIQTLLPDAQRAITYGVNATEPAMIVLGHASNPTLSVLPEVYLESAAAEGIHFSLAGGACTVDVGFGVCVFSESTFAEGTADYELTATSASASESWPVRIIGGTLFVTAQVKAIDDASDWGNLNAAHWTDILNPRWLSRGSRSLPWHFGSAIIRASMSTSKSLPQARLGCSTLAPVAQPPLSGWDIAPLREIAGVYGAGFYATNAVGYSLSGGAGGSLEVLAP